MKIRIKNLFLYIVFVLIFGLVGIAILVWIEISTQSRIHSNSLVFYLLCFVAIMIRCGLFFLRYIYVEADYILVRTLIQKNIINKNEIVKIVVLSYRDIEKYESISIYGKKDDVNGGNKNNNALINISRKKYNLEMIVNAFEKYNYAYHVEYL